MIIDKTIISCGIIQASGVSNLSPESFVIELCKKLKEKELRKKYNWTLSHARPPVVIFSDRKRDKNCYYGGEAVAKYIRKNKLGKVTSTPWFDNPSVVTHKVRLYTWYLDYKALGIGQLSKSYE